MNFNPIYSNILPYGVATPNRNGVYFNGLINNKKRFLLLNLMLVFIQK